MRQGQIEKFYWLTFSKNTKRKKLKLYKDLNAVFQQFAKDSSLTRPNVSLYVLFQYWKMNRFQRVCLLKIVKKLLHTFQNWICDNLSLNVLAI